MRKLILLMLVVMVPFLTIAQKRSKKNAKTEKVAESNATYEFMVIIGSEIKSKNPNSKQTEIRPQKLGMSPKIRINLDFGDVRTQENIGLMKTAVTCRTMVDAVNAAANIGWEFHSANVVGVAGNKVHYYYMRRNK